MQRKISLEMLSIFFFFLLVLHPLSSADHYDVPPHWNNQWVYTQQLDLPISTNVTNAKNQPIDIEVSFQYPCWTKNPNETSIRICCWYRNQWHELESQIYNLVFIDANHINRCNVVFIIPFFADGSERYFVYYHDIPTPIPNYKDHVSVNDAQYIESPIADITAEAQYYKIEEDGTCIYGVGQQGKLFDRPFSQLVVKQKKGMKDFDIFTADSIVSFAFSYYYGTKETDESSSDQRFIHKKIFIDGNLMVCFGIISESEKKDIRTTAVYKYYYNPGDDKRIDVHVKHEMLDNALVQGIDNVDGRYGAIVSFVSRNPVVERLNFGNIYPYVHFYNKNNQIEECRINQNPTSNVREWILSYKDDADLGSQAWISYGAGKQGKAYGVLFATNTGIVSSGTDERDGIQVKIAVKQYFNFLGTEVDYASINFGRNSYEKGYAHDVYIPKNLIVEFDAEVFCSEHGGYPAVQNEAVLYQQLIKSRTGPPDATFEPEQKKYNLTIITHFGGTRFSFPLLVKKTGVKLPTMLLEIYREEQLITATTTNRSWLYKSQKTITDLAEGRYLIKVYRKNDEQNILVGEKTVIINGPTKVHIFCTWEKNIDVTIRDQNNQPIQDVTVVICTKKGDIYSHNITDLAGTSTLKVPFNLREPYTVKMWYKDILIHEQKLNKSIKKAILRVTCPLYDPTVTITDPVGLPPGVPVTPLLTTLQQDQKIIIFDSIQQSPGVYRFIKIPTGRYTLKIQYDTFSDEKQINIPHDGLDFSLLFSARYDLILDFFDQYGNNIPDINAKINFFRNDTLIAQTTQHQIQLPPARYTIKVYAEKENIGITSVELITHQKIKIVTSVQSLLPRLILGGLLTLLCMSICLILIKKISYTMFVKLIIIACIIFSLIQPWWMLNGASLDSAILRETKMFINPPIMFDTIFINQERSYEIAELPMIFTDVLGYILTALLIVLFLIATSILLEILNKKQYSLICTIGSFIILGSVGIGFSVAAEKICSLSVGSLQGEGILGITIQETPTMLQSHWGFSVGYYTIVFSLILVLLLIVNDIKKKIRMYAKP
ncbi:MAG: hypothetical protein QXX20_00700 [Candidatus Thermoplasmatota archaeon]